MQQLFFAIYTQVLLCYNQADQLCMNHLEVYKNLKLLGVESSEIDCEKFDKRQPLSMIDIRRLSRFFVKEFPLQVEKCHVCQKMPTTRKHIFVF